jgi:hypothetical protein
VSELLLLVRQGEQAWLLAGMGGNHEFARAFYFAPKDEAAPRYILKDGKARIGPSTCIGIDVDRDGATFSWDCGRKSHIPQDYFQCTWRAA